MSDKDIEHIISQLEDLRAIKSSNQLVKESFKSLLPLTRTMWKKQCFKILLFFIIALVLSLITTLSNNTIKNVAQIISISNNVELALLGIVFTGFTIFQVLLSDKVLESLLIAVDNTKKNEKEEKSKHGDGLFVNVNNNFYYLLIGYGVQIFLNYIMLLILDVTKAKWVLFSNIIIDNSLCVLALTVYLFINLQLIYEIKYFLFNLFSLFNLSTIIRTKNIIGSKDKE